MKDVELEEGGPLLLPSLQQIPFFTLDQVREDNPWLTPLGPLPPPPLRSPLLPACLQGLCWPLSPWGCVWVCCLSILGVVFGFVACCVCFF
jgi:hypothetical protein